VTDFNFEEIFCEVVFAQTPSLKCQLLKDHEDKHYAIELIVDTKEVYYGAYWTNEESVISQ